MTNIKTAPIIADKDSQIHSTSENGPTTQATKDSGNQHSPIFISSPPPNATNEEFGGGDDSNAKSSKKGNTSLIIGVVVGVIVLLILVLLLVIFIIRKKRNARATDDLSQNEITIDENSIN